jgi:hypothetical protein
MLTSIKLNNDSYISVGWRENVDGVEVTKIENVWTTDNPETTKEIMTKAEFIKKYGKYDLTESIRLAKYYIKQIADRMKHITDSTARQLFYYDEVKWLEESFNEIGLKINLLEA